MIRVVVKIALSVGIAMTGPYAFANELANWSQGARQDFSANKQCITVPATPGVPEKCGPDARVSYPCGSFFNPKICHRTIKGPCTPAIPSTPEHTECAQANLGAVDVHVDGAIEATGSSVLVHNTVHAEVFGQSTHFTWSCEVKADAKYKACIELTNPVNVSVDHKLKPELQYSADVMAAVPPALRDSADTHCQITTPGVDINFDGLGANICTFVDVNNVRSAKPTGTVGAQVHAHVGFGKQSIAGRSIDLGSKSWAKNLFAVDY